MSNFFRVRNGLNLSPVDLTTLTSPQAGDLACDINDSNKIKRYDANLLSWTEVGSGGVGNIDALLTQNFDSAALSQFTQTGLALVTSNTLNGSQTARLIHQSGSPQSFKQVISVDRKYRSQLMQLSLLLQSSAPQGDVTLNIFDETNAVNIVASEQLTTGSQAISGLATTNLSPTISGFTNAVINTLKVGERVTGSGIQTGSIITAINATALTVTISQNATATASGLTLNFSELPARQVVSFVIPASCASISYTITALAEAGLPETYVDDVVIELAETALLETSVEVPVVTAWQGYTPTFQGFGTPTNVEFEWRQVGENVEIRGKFTSGTPTAVEARVGLPAGLTSAGTSLIPSIQVIGGSSTTYSSTLYFSNTTLIEPSVTYLTFGVQTSTTGSLSKATGTAVAVTSTQVSLFASVPCAGLSATQVKEIPLTQSGLVQEADSYLYITGNAGQAITANVTNIPFSTVQQSVGDAFSWNGSQLTVFKTGVYSILGVVVATGNLSNRIQLFKNGVANILISPYTTTSIHYGECSIYLSAGDVVSLRFPDSNTTLVNSVAHNFSATYQGSLKQVNVIANQKATIPTSELRFEGASNRGTGSESTIVQFTTQTRLRGDAFSILSTTTEGTAITMLKAGRLNISSNLVLPSAQTIAISRNQQNRTAFPSGSEVLSATDVTAAGIRGQVSWSGDVNVGDVIRIYAGTTPTANGSNQLNLSFQEQSVQVSVSNVLPQFSESDSSVRVDTANGYGSTGTRIRRFSNVRDNIGADIVYADSATAGSSFTIVTSGIYSVSYSDIFTASILFGISKNASSLTADVQSLSATERLANNTSVANSVANVAWEGYLVAGDVIRAHSNVGTQVNPELASFTISKVGKPNVTGVNVTPFVNVPQPESQVAYMLNTSGFTNADITGTLTSLYGNGIFSYDSTTGVYTILKACTVFATYGSRSNGASYTAPAIIINGSVVAIADSVAASSYTISVSHNFRALPGDQLKFKNSSIVSSINHRISVTATALSDQILTAPETFSTDTAALQYAPSSLYNLTTLSNAPVGTYITFTYAANTNTRTQTTTRPTQTDADMNANGMLIYTRVYASPSTAAQPSTIAIQIGKGLKGKTIDLYKNSGKAIAGNPDLFASGGNNDQYGLYFKDYNEVTGVLLLDAGFLRYATATTNQFWFSDTTVQASGYLVINASKNVSLTGMNIERVAARGINTAGTVMNATGVTMPVTVVFDTHGALNTNGTFTAPETGYYQISASMYYSNATYAVGQAVYIQGFKNGVLYSTSMVFRVGAATTTFMGAGPYSDLVFLGRGETFQVRGVNERGATALDTGTTVNFFSIAKVNIGKQQ